MCRIWLQEENVISSSTIFACSIARKEGHISEPHFREQTSSSRPASLTPMQVVKARGDSMAAAAKAGDPHGMLSIIGLSDADLESVIADARNNGSIPHDAVCQLANYLFPQVRTGFGTQGFALMWPSCRRLHAPAKWSDMACRSCRRWCKPSRRRCSGNSLVLQKGRGSFSCCESVPTQS